MTMLIKTNSNVVSLKAYRSCRNRTRNQPVSGKCWESDGTNRLRSLADGCFLVVLNIVTWAPFIWALYSVTTAP
jgi:hypothetical protein